MFLKIIKNIIPFKDPKFCCMQTNTIVKLPFLQMYANMFETVGNFPFLRSDQSVLKWNTRVLRTGSAQNVPAHGPEPLSSPAPVGQSAGIWRVVVGKDVRARLGPFHLNRPEPVLLGWICRPGKWKATVN